MARPLGPGAQASQNRLSLPLECRGPDLQSWKGLRMRPAQFLANPPLDGLSAPTDELERYRWLLMLRFLLTNLVGFALLGAAWATGMLEPVVNEPSGLCLVIFALFLIGLVKATEKGWMLSHELNALSDPRLAESRVAEHLARLARASAGGRANLATSLRLKLVQRIGIVRHIASTLVILGLIGTVVGFVMALSGVDPATASDVAAIGPMVSALIAGMAVALYTTLTGSVLNVWLMLNYRLLEDGAVHLLTRCIEIGEEHGRA
jgi:biopolymer transport protein ExbB/TolQ